MQKTVFFLQELAEVPLDFEFVLYKHGPFSFDLRDELTFMRAQGFLQLEPQYPYGPSLLPGIKGEVLRAAFQNISDEFAAETRWLAQEIGRKTVAELERIATAFFIISREPLRADVAQRLTALKPHITLSEAKNAISEARRIIRDFSHESDIPGPRKRA